MILRNVIVASDRERLRSARASELTAVPTPAEWREPPAEPPPPLAPSLTVDRVCEWLAAQPTEVRAVCARQLSPDIEACTERARESGHEIGCTQGREEVIAAARSSLGALSQVAAACEQAYSRECAQLAEGCAQIVAEIFRKLAGPALVSREAALGAVLEVLKRVKDERELTLRVSAQDLSFLESQSSAIREALGTRSWSLCADPRVTLGGCLVESSLGTLDGRLELQLQELLETLRAAKVTAGEDT